MTDIAIDTTDYEHRFGKPVGRAFWSFRIVSADPAIRDHVFTTHKPVIFPEACRQAHGQSLVRLDGPYSNRCGRNPLTETRSILLGTTIAVMIDLLLLSFDEVSNLHKQG
jgi:hypothetical protein